MKAPTTSSNHTGNLVALNAWLASLGVRPITASRWRRKGWLQTINICGRVYVARETIADFERRAAAGEFSQEHTAPKRKAPSL
jgi:hypothetical protein